MRREENGALMLYIVIAVVVFSLLAGIMARNYSASTRATARPDCQKAARLMAESGVRYAMGQLRTAPNDATFNSRFTALNGQTFTLANGSSFTLALTGGGTNYTVTATGYAPCLEDVPVSAGLSRTFTVQDPGSDIAFDNGDLSGFDVVAGAGGTNTIVVHNDTSNPGNSSVEMGGGQYRNFGALWYAGSKGDCVEGNCPLGNGLRAYFEFEFNTSSDGDGFVFALISAATNTKSVGGDPNMGELLGYGGVGTDNTGLLPPKIGLEFDIYHNDCNDICSAGSRCDSTYDHMTFVQWGAETGSTVSGNCSGGRIKKRYDDNRHSAGTEGSSTEPFNPTSGDPGFYTQSTSNWLQNGGVFRLRYELTRHTAAASNGYYCYELRAWLQPVGETMTPGLDDLTKDLEATPTVQEVFYLSSTVHAQLNNIFFGWTEGTGAATQLATLRKFALTFKDSLGEPKAMPSDSPVLYLSMRDGSGTTVTDRSSSANDGSLSGSVAWVPGVGCPDCPALAFYGNDADYVTVGDDSSLDLTSAGTVSAWVMLPSTSINGQATLVRKGRINSWTNESYRLYLDNGRPALYARHDNATTQTIMAPTALAANRWYHLAGTWTTGALQLYVDGVSVATGAGVGTLSNSTNTPVLLGHRTTSTTNATYRYGAYSGVLDEVLLYSSALSAAKIQQLYEFGLWGRQ